MNKFFTIIFIWASLFGFTPVMAQDLGALGLPAITSSLDSSGGTTYSLSLQILLLMTTCGFTILVLGMTALLQL